MIRIGKNNLKIPLKFRTSCAKELEFVRLTYSRKIAGVKNGKEKNKRK